MRYYGNQIYADPGSEHCSVLYNNIVYVVVSGILSTDDEYRALVDKYANVRNEFETKMVDSCRVSFKWQRERVGCLQL